MQKLLSLGQKQWFSGISPSSQLQSSGLFVTARKINPFVDPFPNSTQTGILQTSSDPVDISGSFGGTDLILAGINRATGGGTGNLYLITAAGNIYDKDLSNDNAPVALRPGSTFTSPANGLDIYQSTDGSKYLYYFRDTKIGRWDFDGPSGTFVDDWDTGLTSNISGGTSAYHPTHQFKGSVWFGNENAIGRIYSVSGSGATTATTTFLFPADFRVTCIDDDGDYLIAGITKNKGENTLASDTRVLFLDPVSLSQTYVKEWTINDFSINSLTKFENGLMAHCGQGIYYFNISSKPSKIKSLGVPEATRYGFNNSSDNYNETVIWGGGSDFISIYGKLLPEAQRAYLQPFGGLTGSPIYIEANTKTSRIYVGTASPKFYYYVTSTGGGTTTTVPETIYLDFGQEIHLQKIDFLLAEPLAGGDPGDHLTLQIKTDEDNVAQTWATLDYDSNEINPRRKRYETFLDGGIISNQFKLLLNFTAGNIKIKEINLYGEPIRYN